MTRTKMHWAADIAAGLGGLTAIGALLAVVPDDWRPYVAALGALLLAVSKWLEQHAPQRASKLPVGPTAVLLALALALAPALAVAPACQPFETEWRTVSALKAAGELTDRAIAEAAVVAHEKCIIAHGAGTAGYKACIGSAKAYKALVGWRKYGRPTINSGLLAAVTALQIAEKAKTSKLDLAAVLKPAACALSKMVQQYGDLLIDKVPIILVAVAMLKRVSCE